MDNFASRKNMIETHQNIDLLYRGNMKKNKILNDIDSNIVEALLKIKIPIKGKNGKLFYVRDEARYESGIEHIALKRHRLKVRDIESISSILKHPAYESMDPNNINYRNYYGIRKGINKGQYLLKIVTWSYENDSNKELIITIFPTKSIKNWKRRKIM